jgi:hypothetical protein
MDEVNSMKLGYLLAIYSTLMVVEKFIIVANQMD